MPTTLPAGIITQKNKVNTPYAWVILAEIVLSPTVTIRMCKNTDPIVFESNTFIPYMFEIDGFKSNSQGEIPSISFSVSNVERMLQPYIEQYLGGVGATVRIVVINSAPGNEAEIALEMTYDVISSSSNNQMLVLNLGAPNPLRQRFPLYRAISMHCNWTFKSRECNYAGSDITCQRTLDDCSSKSNTSRFGGRTGLKSEIRFA